jgi:hypothetical protein
MRIVLNNSEKVRRKRGKFKRTLKQNSGMANLAKVLNLHKVNGNLL